MSEGRDWIKIPPPPERLDEIRSYADMDVLDMVEPEEMYWFLGLVDALATIESLGSSGDPEAYGLSEIARKAREGTS